MFGSPQVRWALVLCLLCLIPLIAQEEPQPPNVTPNLVHDRHTHHHNHPHPTVEPTPDRFFTTRASEVVLPLPEEKDAFVFAVFGDRTGGPADGVNILADAVRDVNLIEPDLVMTVGDLINGYNRTPEWLGQMREFKAIMNELLCPWFPVAGNHDTYWRPLNDPTMLADQHDSHYEMHFGPLWYSFQHKNCNFIVLYSDEGDPETGEKNFSKPSAQKVSDEQYAFLKESLQRGEESDHQFLFLHHPRWLGGGYGNDWQARVHPLLKEAGNVTAVFAGHIHYMRYDPQDGIEYVTLATVGGGQSGRLPEAGYLHQYHLVTVRPKQVAMAAFPVGEAINVREVTAELQRQASLLANQRPRLDGAVTITENGPQPTRIKATVANPTDRPIDFTLTATTADRRWAVSPDHTHGHLKAGESSTVIFAIDYRGDSIDSEFQGIDLLLAQDYLAPTTRYSIPESRTTLPFKIEMAEPTVATTNRALSLDGQDDAVAVPCSSLKLPQGPFTLEAWFNAKSFSNRVGLLAKTESSEFSIFMSNGLPSFSVYLGDRYRNVTAPEKVPTNQWMHIAAVQDTDSLSLFIDGKLANQIEIDPDWKRRTNTLPFYIGADTDRNGKAMSYFHGMVDEVRLSKGAVYTEDFTPERRMSANDETVLMMNFDQTVGPFHLDAGPHQSHATSQGGSTLVEVRP